LQRQDAQRGRAATKEDLEKTAFIPDNGRWFDPRSSSWGEMS
jgi:hypothetical protein